MHLHEMLSIATSFSSHVRTGLAFVYESTILSMATEMRIEIQLSTRHERTMGALYFLRASLAQMLCIAVPSFVASATFVTGKAPTNS